MLVEIVHWWPTLVGVGGPLDYINSNSLKRIMVSIQLNDITSILQGFYDEIFLPISVCRNTLLIERYVHI